MSKENSFKHSLLVATPLLSGEDFNECVIYVYEHTPTGGAEGLIVNKPTKRTIRDISTQLSIPLGNKRAGDQIILRGGVLSLEQGFMLFSDGGELVLSNSRETLECFCQKSDSYPDELLFALGNVTWAPGELEEELIDNHWLLAPPARHILFSVPFERRWEAAACLLGINNLNLFLTTTGHA